MKKNIFVITVSALALSACATGLRTQVNNELA